MRVGLLGPCYKTGRSASSGRRPWRARSGRRARPRRRRGPALEPGPLAAKPTRLRARPPEGDARLRFQGSTPSSARSSRRLSGELQGRAEARLPSPRLLSLERAGAGHRKTGGRPRRRTRTRNGRNPVRGPSPRAPAPSRAFRRRGDPRPGVREGRCRTLPPRRFRALLTLFSKSFSSFPHGTCSLSVSRRYLALDGVHHPLRAAIPSNPTLRGHDATDGDVEPRTGPSPSSAPLSRGLRSHAPPRNATRETTIRERIYASRD